LGRDGTTPKVHVLPLPVAAPDLTASLSGTNLSDIDAGESIGSLGSIIVATTRDATNAYLSVLRVTNLAGV
jgi:hypothetical protein